MRIALEGVVQQVQAWANGDGTDVYLLQNSKGAPGIARVTWGKKAEQGIPKVGEKVNLRARVFLSKGGGLLCFAE